MILMYPQEREKIHEVNSAMLNWKSTPPVLWEPVSCLSLTHNVCACKVSMKFYHVYRFVKPSPHL